MNHTRSKRSQKKIGSPPGTLMHIGEQKTEHCRIKAISFNGEDFSEKEVFAEHLSSLAAKISPQGVLWVNLDGLHQIPVIEQFGTTFGIHPLVLEDILNTHQRPKMEDFENYLFIVVKLLHLNGDNDSLWDEQVCIVVGPGMVLSFQEVEGDVFDSVRDRLRSAKGRIRKLGADYLAYALIDSVVDSYFALLEKIGERIEDLEDELIETPTPETLQKIHRLKREMILLRRAVWPLREVVSALQRDNSGFISDTTDVYLRDLYDHTIQVADTTETYRDIISGMLDLYLSSLSNRMNEIMKVLTIIASIFIPLSFVAGVYGMNFEYMPELKWRWSYPLLWLFLIATGGGMWLFFRKKKWI